MRSTDALCLAVGAVAPGGLLLTFLLAAALVLLGLAHLSRVLLEREL